MNEMRPIGPAETNIGDGKRGAGSLTAADVSSVKAAQ